MLFTNTTEKQRHHKLLNYLSLERFNSLRLDFHTVLKLMESNDFLEYIVKHNYYASEMFTLHARLTKHARLAKHARLSAKKIEILRGCKTKKTTFWHSLKTNWLQNHGIKM